MHKLFIVCSQYNALGRLSVIFVWVFQILSRRSDHKTDNQYKCMWENMNYTAKDRYLNKIDLYGIIQAYNYPGLKIFGEQIIFSQTLISGSILKGFSLEV